jgi:hypothetical protein
LRCARLGWGALGLCVIAAGCRVGPGVSAGRDTGPAACVVAGRRCDRGVLVACDLDERGLLREARTECFSASLACDPDLGCVACLPGTDGCAGADQARCRADGSGWEVTGTCDTAAGLGCLEGSCQDLCAAAERDRGYLGCEFRAVDLDNGVDGVFVAAAEQFAVVVSNPSPVPAAVVVEADSSGFGESPDVDAVLERTVAAGGVEVLALPARSVDGASDARLNDGTHSAVTRAAYRLRSSAPVAAYQFNPLTPRETYSEDASLLLPVTAWGDRYTVVGWPQTIGSPPPIVDGPQQRSFLTIAAGPEGARVAVTLGPAVGRTAGCPQFPVGQPGDRVEIELGPLDVLNLETDRLGGDFTGSVVEASRGVAVWVGAEMADVPYLPGARVAAADHLEEQLLPDRSLGNDFVITPMPSRSRAVARAFDDLESSPVGPGVAEPDWVRLVNAGARSARVTTGLPPPLDAFELAPREVRELRLDGGAHLRSDEPLSVVQWVSGQELTGIPFELPGGDPAMLLVPPTTLFRDRHVVLVPPYHAFDFVLVYAPVAARGSLDGEPLGDRCLLVPIDEAWVAYHCQLGFPVLSADEPRVRSGVQADGAHTIAASLPVGVVVYGWDRYISYAYPGALSTVPLR